jgi:hypothetical protein
MTTLEELDYFLFFFLDEKEPKNQENLKLAYPPAGAARKIFGPAHKGSKGDCLGGQASFNGILCLPACGEVNCFLFGVLWIKMIREAGNASGK